MQVETPYVQLNLNAAGEQAEILTAYLAEAGFESFVEEGQVLQAFCTAEAFASPEARELTEKLQAQKELGLEIIRHEWQNWNQTWEENFEPVRIGRRVYIRAEHHVPDAGVEVELVIQPKMSFGTGHHDTTALMVEALLETEPAGKSLLEGFLCSEQ